MNAAMTTTVSEVYLIFAICDLLLRTVLIPGSEDIDLFDREVRERNGRGVEVNHIEGGAFHRR